MLPYRPRDLAKIAGVEFTKGMIAMFITGYAEMFEKIARKRFILDQSSGSSRGQKAKVF